MANSKVIIVLPTSGSPFLWKNKVFGAKADLTSELKKIICTEDVEKIMKSALMIHPSFDNRWQIVASLLKEKVEIYVNGSDTFCPNVACLNRTLRCNPFFGEIAMVVPYALLKGENDPQYLTLVRVEDYYEEIGVDKPAKPSSEEDYESHLGGYLFRPRDLKQDKKFNDFAKGKNWFRASAGQVYLNRTEWDVEELSDDD